MRSLVLAALLVLSPAARAADHPGALVTKTFAVADLVTPVPDYPSADKVKAQTPADGAAKLVRTVTTMVRAHSWDTQGGPGKIEYRDLDHSLVVTNTQAAINETADLLSALRKLQDTNVVTEVRVISVAPGFRDAVGVACGDGAVLSERELAALLGAAQADRRVTIMQTPKVSTFDGQVATVHVGEQRLFATALETKKQMGHFVLVPKQTPANLGDTLTLCGRVGGDGKSVALRVNVTRTHMASEKVEAVPATTFITPVFADGGRGQKVPFTQFIQVPDLKTYTAERTATVPSCGTLVVGGWKETRTAEFGPSAVGKIPYLNRLFKSVGIEERDVVVLATTRVVTPGDAEMRPIAPPCDAVVTPYPAVTRAAGQAMPVAPAVPVVYPERYNTAARQEVIAPFAAQAANDTAIDRTLWNWHFEPGTATLTPAGVVKLEYLANTIRAGDARVHLQTALDADKVSDRTRRDLKPETVVDLLNVKRTDVIQKKLRCTVTLIAAANPPAVPVPSLEDVTVRTHRLLYSGEDFLPAPRRDVHVQVVAPPGVSFIPASPVLTRAVRAMPAAPPLPVPVAEDYTVRTQRLLYSGEGGGPSPHAKQVKMDMAFVEVPADFMAKIGLPADAIRDTRVWTLTGRERDMFDAAVRNAPDRKMLSEPQIVTHEGRPARVRAGGSMSLVTGLDVSVKDGNTVVLPKTTAVDCGISASVMPMLAADGKSIRLHVAVTQATNLDAPKKHPVVIPVETEKGKPASAPLTFTLEDLPKQDIQSVDLTVVVPEAGTVVVGGIVRKTAAGKATELLIVLTPSVVKPQPAPVVTPVTPAGATLPGLKYDW